MTLEHRVRSTSAGQRGQADTCDHSREHADDHHGSPPVSQVTAGQESNRRQKGRAVLTA